MFNHLSGNSSGLPERCDVAIIGSGPAGLATAIELKKLGVSDIIVLERADEAGGNPRHCGHSPFGMSEFKRIYMGPAYARKMLDITRKLAIHIALNTTVTTIDQGGLLTLSTPQGITRLKAGKVVLSTGIREMPRAPRLVSGQRPAGILTTGALQSMVYLSHKKPFQRPVIVGSELVAFSAIASCRHAGIKPVAMLEENQRITANSALQLYPRVLGIEVLAGTKILAIKGKQQVTGIDVINTSGTTRHMPCDGVIFSGKFTPEASLARMGHLEIDPQTQGPIVDQYGRCSDPDYFAAGNVLRPVETGGWCWNEGLQTARFVHSSLSGKLPGTRQQLQFHQNSSKIKYILPQRISIDKNNSDHTAMKHIQLRFEEPVNGQISIDSGHDQIYSKKIKSCPERRVLIPLPVLTDSHANRKLSLNFCENI